MARLNHASKAAVHALATGSYDLSDASVAACVSMPVRSLVFRHHHALHLRGLRLHWYKGSERPIPPKAFAEVDCMTCRMHMEHAMETGRVLEP